MSVMEADWSIKGIIIEGFRWGGKEPPPPGEHDKIRSDLCALLIHILRSAGTVAELHHLGTAILCLRSNLKHCSKVFIE